jgi:hypothetical protein
VRATLIGKDNSRTVDLQPGLLIVRGRHAGPDSFFLDLTLPYPGVSTTEDYDTNISVFNETGAFNGARAVRVERAGTYVLDLQSSGTYELEFEQPSSTTTPGESLRQFSGHGTQVTPIVAMPAGRVRVHLTHDGTAPFRVTLFDLHGTKVAGQLVDESGDFDGTVTIEIVLSAPHIFSIEADGDWTMSLN